MDYIVLEVQLNNGVPAITPFAFTNAQRKQALAKYYYILSIACESNIDMHGAFYLSGAGELLKSEIFDNRE